MKTLTPAEAAARLGLSERHVRHLAATGAFPGTTSVGEGYRKSWLIPAASVEGYVRGTRGWRKGRPRKTAPPAVVE